MWGKSRSSLASALVWGTFALGMIAWLVTLWR